MDVLIETYNRLLSETSDPYIRNFYKDFKFDHRITGIVGARGVGKTSFLLYYLKKHYQNSDQGLYVSADHLYFSDKTLYGLVEQFYKEYAGELLCIDEIHKYKNWNQELKNIYDSFPKMKILFSGSSSMDLIKGKFDLSRRVSLKRMTGFSFREFLEVKLNKKFPVLSLEDIIDGKYSKNLSEIPKLLKYLKEYLQEGFYPIFMELNSYEAYREALVNVVDKIIYEDISTFYALKTQNLDSFRKIIYFIASSSPGGFSVNNLALSLHKDHTTISEYLEMLRESGILRYLLNNKKGHALIRKAEKIFFNNTNLIFAINNTIGKETDLGMLRELYVLSHLEDAGYKVFYTDQGDLQCGKYSFEIGGKSKNKKQIKNVAHGFLVKDDSLLTTKNSIPLYIFGFLS